MRCLNEEGKQKQRPGRVHSRLRELWTWDGVVGVLGRTEASVAEHWALAARDNGAERSPVPQCCLRKEGFDSQTRSQEDWEQGRRAGWRRRDSHSTAHGVHREQEGPGWCRGQLDGSGAPRSSSENQTRGADGELRRTRLGCWILVFGDIT